MKILLLSFYDLGKQPKIISEVYSRINSNDVEVDVIDYSIENIDVDTSLYDAIGIYASMHTASVLAQKFLQNKILPKKIFSFGLYGKFLSDSNKNIHYLDDFESDEFSRYLNIKLNNNFSLKNTVPNRKILPDISNYAHLTDGNNKIISGSADTTYGCKHSCTHCPVPIVFNGRFKTYSEKKIIQDVNNQIDQGARHISFNDPDFFNGPKYSLKILESLKNKFPSVTYDSTIKVEHILKYEKYFTELSNLNMLFVISAFETTNDKILNILQKNHSFYDITKATEISLLNKIDIRPTWMPFTPWTELIDLHNIISFIEKYQLRETVDPIQLTIKLLIPNDSLILKTPEIHNYIDEYDTSSFSYLWSYKNSNVDELQKRLFEYVVESNDIDENTQYLDMVNLIEEFSDISLLGINDYHYKKTPKLSESWFCCSEPNQIQLNRIRSNTALI